jgi:hypothetical protein
VIALPLALVAVMGACGGGGDDSETVDVLESEWLVQPDPASVEAGEVTFNVDNQGSEEHELFIVEGDDPGALPTKADGSLDEDQLGHAEAIGHIEGIQAGSSKSDTFELEAGSYLLVCNLVDEMGDVHFAEGMVSPFTVT